MATVEELSERILDEAILHSDIPEETIDKFIEIGLPNPIFPDELENAIAHYGVLGMKWFDELIEERCSKWKQTNS